MKNTKFIRVLAFVIASVMLIGMMPVIPFAASVDYVEGEGDYYKLISKNDYELAPGVVESEIVLNNAEGTHRQVAHVVEVDITNPYTKVMPSYKGMAEGLANKDYGVQIMSQQAAYAEANGYGNVVAAMNISLSWYDSAYYQNHPELVGEPLGYMIMDGVQYTNSQGKTSGAQTCLVINFDEKDGVARPTDIPKTEIRATSSAITGWEEQVIPANFGFLVKNGKNQYKVDNNAANGASRSFVGIKADGSIVMVMNDGRQAPYSAGFTNYEMAEFMLSLGCVQAINGDGGGSSAFLSQRPGEELKINCSPSDGAERETTHGILVISTAPATGEFVQAHISAENDYYTPNSSVQFSALGTDLVGTAAPIPENAVWQLADASFGTIENGLFVSNGKQGEVVVQMAVAGEIVGEDTIYIVMPDTLKFAQANMVIPYGKTVDLGFSATYDNKSVVLKATDVTFTLSDNGIGTINGFDFTAAKEGVTSTEAVLTAQIGTVSVTTNLSLGKGSDIAYDFENQDLTGWTIATNYPQYGPMGSKKDPDGNYYYNGQNELGYLSIVNSSTGKVKNGNYALAVECNFSQNYETGFHSLNMRFPAIDTTDAVAVGFWVYIPFDARFSDMTINSVLGSAFFADGSALELREGWHYLSLPIADVTGGSFYDISFSIDERASAKDANNQPYYDHINTPNLNAKYTLYFDDFTVDYSSAVDDREAPIFSTPTLMNPANETATVLNGQTINYNTVSLEATVAENMNKTNAVGIDDSTAKAYIDGRLVDFTYANGKFSITSVKLADGYHTVKFSIADKMGNDSWISGSFIVDSDSDASTVQVVPQNPTADRILIGSLYWLDVVATDIETIEKVEMVFNMNNASSWELEGLTVAEGFTATYDVQTADNIATIIIERTGENSATGEAVLASFPVRTWVSTLTQYEGYEDQTPATLVSRGIIWAQSIELALEKGIITYVENYDTDVVGSFDMKDILVDTEIFFTNYTRKSVAGAQAWIDAKKAAKVGWHEHTVTALDDLAPTCTKPGYTDRTFCAVCNSVVDWGTTVPATGHSYVFDEDGKLSCACDKVFNGVYTDGKTYVDGVVIADGWVGESYYQDGFMLVGVQLIDGKYYDFGADGVCAHKYPMSAEWWTDENGDSRYLNAGVPVIGYNFIFPNPTFFDENGIAFDGEFVISGETCVFEKGVFVESTTAEVLLAGLAGPKAYFVLYADGTFVLSGEGATYDYVSTGSNFGPTISWKNRPWGKEDQPMAKSIKNVIIGKDITVLGVYTFYQCTNIKTITFEEGSKLTKINSAAFCWAPYLKEVDIPDTVTYIGNTAFAYCENLVNVRVPQDVTYINETAFKSSSKVVLNVTEGTYGERYAENMGIAHVTREYVNIPVATGTCGENATWAFYSNGQLVISGSGAMANYTSQSQQPWAAYRMKIKEIVIGKDITHVGQYAFAFAHNVKSVTFEEGSNLESIGPVSFYYIMYTKQIVLPETLRTVGNLAFAYCDGLTNLYVPQGTTSISSSAFKNTSKVVLDVAETSYGETYAKKNNMAYTTRAYVYVPVVSGVCGTNATWAFYSNGQLVISGSGAMADYTSQSQQPWAAYRLQIKEIVIGKDITHVGQYAFAYAHYVQSVTFEEGSKLESIGAVSFYYVMYTKQIVLPETAKTIGNLAFAYCDGLTNLYLPQGMTSISSGAFKNTNKVVLNVAETSYAETFAKKCGVAYTTRAYVYAAIASGTCGENATWALYDNGQLVVSGFGAMEDYTSQSQQPWAAYRNQIKHIVIGKDITHVGNYAFAYAHYVQSVTFEEGSKLESIGAVSFYYFLYMTEIDIPETVKSIGNLAFGYCGKLAVVTMGENVSVHAKAFFNTAYKA